MTGPALRILVVETKLEGHHAFYLRLVLEALREAHWEVHLALPAEAEFAGRFARESGVRMAGISLVPLPSGRAAVVRALAQAAQSLKPDLVFFNDFDFVASSWCRRAAVGWMPPAVLRGKICGFYVRPRFLEPQTRGWSVFWKRRGFFRMAESGWFKRLFVLDEYLAASLSNGPSHEIFQWTPDPWSGKWTSAATDARKRLELPQDRPIVLHFGTGSPRKGLPRVVDAMKSLSPEQRPFLICAGRLNLEPDLAKRLQKLAEEGSARVWDRFVEESERELLFAAVDLVLLAYEGHYGSSGVLANAAAANKPVVATDAGLVGRRVREWHLGATFPPEDTAALAKWLTECAEGKLPSAEGTRKFAEAHAPDVFKRNLLSGLKSALKK